MRYASLQDHQPLQGGTSIRGYVNVSIRRLGYFGQEKSKPAEDHGRLFLAGLSLFCSLDCVC